MGNVMLDEKYLENGMFSEENKEKIFYKLLIGFVLLSTITAIAACLYVDFLIVTNLDFDENGVPKPEDNYVLKIMLGVLQTVFIPIIVFIIAATFGGQLLECFFNRIYSKLESCSNDSDSLANKMMAKIGYFSDKIKNCCDRVPELPEETELLIQHNDLYTCD